MADLSKSEDGAMAERSKAEDGGMEELSKAEHGGIEELAQRLQALGAIQFGTFRLKDGSTSPVYLDLRLLVSDPSLLWQAAQAYASLLARLDFDRLAAVPYAGLPIGTAVALATGRPLLYPRREAKGYGTGQEIEGRYRAGETVVLLDDVISSGASKLEAIRKLEAAGLKICDVVVLIDRQGTGRAELAAAGYRLHAVATLRELVAALAASGSIRQEQAAAVVAYLARSRGQAMPS